MAIGYWKCGTHGYWLLEMWNSWLLASGNMELMAIGYWKYGTHGYWLYGTHGYWLLDMWNSKNEIRDRGSGQEKAVHAAGTKKYVPNYSSGLPSLGVDTH